MKVKNESYLRSLTALLRETFKNSSDPNDRLHYATVPSITFIWTRRPQWRRRHKNSKKSKNHRFPLPPITSRIDESDFWDTLKLLENRPFSRSSTSPYETCSSRPLVGEADLSHNDEAQRNREVSGSSSNQRDRSSDRKSPVCETRSDSGLRWLGGTPLVRSIRSQKRLADRSSANSQNTLGSLEVNKSMRSSVGRGLSSDCSIPKRRVTFSNYVSENSATDTRSQISGSAIDNDPREAAWWEESYARLTDGEDDFSLQTNLSRLFSSTIFEDSRSSFFSLTASLNSEKSKKSKKSAVPLGTDCNECIFYVNPSYSNESSCDLQSLPKIYAIDDCPEIDGSMIGNRYRDGECIGKMNEFRAVRSDEKISERVNSKRKINELQTVMSDEKISERVETDGEINELRIVRSDETISKRIDSAGNINELQMMRSDEKINKRVNPVGKINESQEVRRDEKIFERVNPDGKINELQTVRSDEKISKGIERDGKINRLQTVRSDEKTSKRVKPDGMINELQMARSDEKISKRLDRNGKVNESRAVKGDEKISKLVNTNGRINEWQTVRDDEKMYERVVPDAKIFRQINTDPTHQRSIECITIRLKDISSTVKEVTIGGSDSVERRDYEYFSKNHASTDTTDLVVVDLTRSWTPVAGSLKNRCANGAKSSVGEIFDFLREPNQPHDYSNSKVLGKLNELQMVRSDEKISARVAADAKMYREINTDQAYRRSTFDFLPQSKQPHDYSNSKVLGKLNELQMVRSDEKISARIAADAKMYREINTDQAYRRSTFDFLPQSNKPYDYRNGKVLGNLNELQMLTSDEKISARIAADAKMYREINTDQAYRRSTFDFLPQSKQPHDYSNSKVLGKLNELQMVRSDEKISARIAADAKMYREINTDQAYRRSTFDFLPQSNKPYDYRNGKVLGNLNELQMLTSDEKISDRVVADAKMYREISTDQAYRRSTFDFLPQSNQPYHFRNGKVLGKLNELQMVKSDEKISERVVADAKMYRNINTDQACRRSTFDFLPQSNQPYDYHNGKVLGKLNELQMLRSDEKKSERIVADAKMYREINTDQAYRRSTFDFLRQPSDRIDAAFLLKELSRVGAQAFGDRVFDTAIGNIRTIRETDVMKDCRKSDNVDLLRIDAETYGQLETVLIEVENLGGCFEENEIPKKSSSSRLRDCLRQPCESLIVNLPEIGKSSELVASSASNFHNDYANCPGIDKCCLICGRKKTDNPRYLRPVCQVRGVIPSSRLENDPWINVMNKVIKHENSKELMPNMSRTTKNANTKDDQRSLAESSKDSNSSVSKNSSNDPPLLVRNESESVVEEVQEERSLSVTITGGENSPSSMSTLEPNVRQMLSSMDQSTSCPPELERSSSTSFGFATFRAPRAQSAKTYFVRESVRTVEGTANRLLCVISESDSLMAVPPFLPKKPPDWFVRHRIPTRKLSRR